MPNGNSIFSSKRSRLMIMIMIMADGWGTAVADQPDYNTVKIQ